MVATHFAHYCHLVAAVPALPAHDVPVLAGAHVVLGLHHHLHWYLHVAQSTECRVFLAGPGIGSVLGLVLEHDMGSVVGP